MDAGTFRIRDVGRVMGTGNGHLSPAPSSLPNSFVLLRGTETLPLAPVGNRSWERDLCVCVCGGGSFPKKLTETGNQSQVDSGPEKASRNLREGPQKAVAS